MSGYDERDSLSEMRYGDGPLGEGKVAEDDYHDRAKDLSAPFEFDAPSVFRRGGADPKPLRSLSVPTASQSAVAAAGDESERAA